ncbi:MAG: hypothetical protein R2781_04010 [Flavobacteriaceae bacterium]
MSKEFNLSTLLTVLVFIFCFSEGLSQGDSQVYLVDIAQNTKGFQFQNFKKISTDKGYNNQPYFKDNTTLLYAKNKEGQTDIGCYNLIENSEIFWNSKTEGGEYSPQPIPNRDDIAAVRLDPDGLQRLYRYPKNGVGKELIPNAVVVYYCFYDENTVVSSVIITEELHLIVYDLKGEQSYKLLKGSGRSIHKIPLKEAVSYSAENEELNFDIYQLDMDGLESYFICQLPIGVQDYVWWDDARIIIGSGAQLFMYDLFSTDEWKKIADFSEHNITNITRLAISPDGTQLALVAEPKN